MENLNFEILKDLEEIRDWLEGAGISETEIRLQFFGEFGEYRLHTGASDYDQDHSGFWGSGVISQNTDLLELSEELLSEALDSYYA